MAGCDWHTIRVVGHVKAMIHQSQLAISASSEFFFVFLALLLKDNLINNISVTKGVFGFLVSITHNSVSITHNSKMVGPMTQKLVWISITLFPVFVSIT